MRRDRLLHQRAAEVVDAPAQRLGGGVEAHLHPAGLQVADAAAEREPEDRGVLEVLLARDLLDAVRAAEQRVERDERQRHELGEAAGALLQLAHDAHVLGQLPRLLDVAEHHRHGRAQARRRALASMISTQRATGSLFGLMRSRTPSWSTSAAVPGVESRPGLAQAREDRARRQARRRRTCGRPPSASRRAGAASGRELLGDAQPALVVLEPPVGVDARLHAAARSRRRRRPRATRVGELLARRARRRRASAGPGRSRRTRSRRCRRWRR